MTETPSERRASERARYLAATTDLADREAEAVGDLTPVTTEDIADWSDHRRRM